MILLVYLLKVLQAEVVAQQLVRAEELACKGAGHIDGTSDETPWKKDPYSICLLTVSLLGPQYTYLMVALWYSK